MNRALFPSAVTAFVKSLIVLAAVGLGTAQAQERRPTAPHAAGAVKIDPAKGGTLYDSGDTARGLPACVSCHGAAGNSTIVANPKLSGQVSNYVYKQLVDFTGPDRVNPIMTTYAKMMTDEEKKNVAAYVAAQTAKPGAAKNKDTIDLGRKIYRGGIADKGVAACASCHGAAGAGLPIQYPRTGRPAPGLHRGPIDRFPQRRPQKQRADDDPGQAHVGRGNESRGRLYRRPEITTSASREQSRAAAQAGRPFFSQLFDPATPQHRMVSMSSTATAAPAKITPFADLVELVSSMRFAISLLAIIAISAMVGTVMPQNAPMPNYVDQFGPFWFEVFKHLGLYAVYSAWWFLLILVFLIASTGLCIARNGPKMLKDMRSLARKRARGIAAQFSPQGDLDDDIVAGGAGKPEHGAAGRCRLPGQTGGEAARHPGGGQEGRVQQARLYFRAQRHHRHPAGRHARFGFAYPLSTMVHGQDAVCRHRPDFADSRRSTGWDWAIPRSVATPRFPKGAAARSPSFRRPAACWCRTCRSPSS